VTDTFGDLDVFQKHGGKLLTFVGGNDQLIMPRGVHQVLRLGHRQPRVLERRLIRDRRPAPVWPMA
jgi:hypothetical protein